jgi:hypothetical protein
MRPRQSVALQIRTLPIEKLKKTKSNAEFLLSMKF